MILLHEQGLRFIDVPRTASRAMEDALSGVPGAARHKQHGTSVPTEAKGFPVFFCHRNPYPRVYSHWRKQSTALSWGQYAIRCKDTIIEGWVSGARIADCCEFAGLPDTFYNMATRLGVVPPPVLDETHRVKRRRSAGWREHYTEAIASAVWDFSRMDFERFGYCKDSWK